MKRKNVLIITSHPKKDSFNGGLAEAYIQGVGGLSDSVKHLHLEDMEFDPVLHGASDHVQALEPDLIQAQKDITWADHFVFVMPLWWAGMPAKLKGFFDRVFLSGFAYKYGKSGLPVKLLKGKSADVLITMDSPMWYYRWYYGSSADRQLKRGILQFCGINPVGVHFFPMTRKSKPDKRARWLKQVERLAKKMISR